MRIVLLIFISFSTILALSISVKDGLDDELKKYKSVEIIKTKSAKDSFLNLKKQKSQMAVLRADIVYFANNGLENFKYKDFLILSKIKKESYLYLIGRDDETIKYITDFRKKKVSIGNVNDMANKYLKKVLDSIEGIKTQVSFKAYPLEISLRKIKDKKIDYLFAFADKDFSKSVIDNGLVIYPLSEDIMKILLKTNKAFVKIGQRLKLDNYVVVSNTVEASNLKDFVKDLKKDSLLLVNTDKELGQKYDTTKVVSLIEEEEKEKKELGKKKKEITKATKNLKSSLKKISKKEKMLSLVLDDIRRKADKFQKKSKNIKFNAEADKLKDRLELEKEKLQLKLKNANVNELIKDVKVDELSALTTEVDNSLERIMELVAEAKSVNSDVNIALAEEDEEQFALAEQERKIEERQKKLEEGKSFFKKLLDLF